MTATAPFDAAIAALQAQRALLGDAVVDLAVQALHALKSQRSAEAPAEQRLRQVSVLFTDVVGSTQLSQHLSPEQIGEVMDGALASFSRIVQAHGGKVLQYAGDSMLAAFGTPLAHEDDAERAVHAALRILTEAQELAAAVLRRHRFEGFGVRAGIATGSVLLGGGVDGEHSIRGITVNTAARMEQTAPPGGLRVCPDTWRHVRGLFEAQAQAPLQVKGRDEPLKTWFITGLRRDAPAQAERGIGADQSPFVAREAELAELRAAYHALAAPGTGLQMRVVLAEAGVGKSRLAEEFLRWAEAQGHALSCLQAHALQRDASRPYGALRQWLAQPLQVLDGHDAAVQRRRWLDGMVPLLGSLADAAVLGQLLGLDFADDPAVRPLLDRPRALRDRAFHHATQVLQARTGDATRLVLLLNDMHWADSGSQEFVGHLLAQAAELPVLLLVLARPDVVDSASDWLLSPHCRFIHLQPLDDSAADQLARALLASLGQAPEALLQRLLQAAEGNPYYLEEYIGMLLDHGVLGTGGPGHASAADMSSWPAPTSLAAVIQARLDTLPAPVEAIVRTASVVGPVFWEEALATRAELAPVGDHAETPARVRSGLAALQQRQITQPQAPSDLQGFTQHRFRHQLLQKVAYSRVLERDRRRAHAQVAAWLQGLPGEPAPHQVAEHLEQAGEHAAAARAWARAASAAQAVYANSAALAHAARALALCAPGEHRLRFELQLLRSRVLGLLAEPKAQAEALSDLEQQAVALGDASAQAQALLEQAHERRSAGDAAASLARAERAGSLARDHDPHLALRARIAQVSALQDQGRLVEAQQQAELARELARRAGDITLHGTLCNALGMIAIQRGQLSQARRHLAEALDSHRQVGDLDRMGGTASNLAYLDMSLGQYTQARLGFEEVRTIFQRIGQRANDAVVQVNLAIVALNEQHPALALGLAQRAVPALQAANSRVMEAAAQRVAGQALLALGDPAAAARALAQAQQTFEAQDCAMLALEAQAAAALAGHLAHDESALDSARRVGERLLQLGAPEGAEEPLRIYHDCWQVLQACGDAQAERLRQAAVAELHGRAARIEEPLQRESYLNQVPYHAWLQAGLPAG